MRNKGPDFCFLHFVLGSRFFGSSLQVVSRRVACYVGTFLCILGGLGIVVVSRVSAILGCSFGSYNISSIEPSSC